MTVNVHAAYEWRGGTGENSILGTSNASDIDTNTYQKMVAPLDRALANYRQLMNITYNSASQLTVSAGEVVCTNSALTIRKMRQNTSGTTVTWSDIDTGAEASATTYYVYANCDADAETATFKISASSTSPSGVTSYKKLGSFYNDSSSNITRIDNYHIWNEIGEKESKSDGVTYQATVDGYFIGLIDASGSTGSYGDIIGYSDNSSSPTTVMGYASGWRVDSTYSASTGNRKNSFIFPVKAGDYYKGSSSTTGSVTVTFYFVPKN